MKGQTPRQSYAINCKLIPRTPANSLGTLRLADLKGV